MDIYSKVTPLTSNAQVKCKGILVQCISGSPRSIILYTYGATFAGQTSSQEITITPGSIHVIPIQVAGVSFNSTHFPSTWGLN